MNYTAEQARADQNAVPKTRELESNLELIRQSARNGGHWCYVHFALSGIETMKAELTSRGFTVEVTHKGIGLKASW